jgi:hypothetical protein
VALPISCNSILPTWIAQLPSRMRVTAGVYEVERPTTGPQVTGMVDSSFHRLQRQRYGHIIWKPPWRHLSAQPFGFWDTLDTQRPRDFLARSHHEGGHGRGPRSRLG